MTNKIVVIYANTPLSITLLRVILTGAGFKPDITNYSTYGSRTFVINMDDLNWTEAIGQPEYNSTRAIVIDKNDYVGFYHAITHPETIVTPYISQIFLYHGAERKTFHEITKLQSDKIKLILGID